MASSDGVQADGICPIRRSPAIDRRPCEECPVRSTTICSALDDAAIAELGRVCTAHRFPAGYVVAMEGDSARCCFSLVTGAAKLYKSMADGRTQITGFLGPGDFFGLPGQSRLPFTLETTRESELRAFPMDALEALFARNPGLDRRFHEWIGNEIIAEQEHVLLLGCKTAIERLASFLLLVQARQTAAPGGRPGREVGLLFSRSDLAGYLGLSVETVSRAFTRLRKEGLIDLPNPQLVVIRDHAALAALADGEVERHARRRYRAVGGFA